MLLLMNHFKIYLVIFWQFFIGRFVTSTCAVYMLPLVLSLCKSKKITEHVLETGECVPSQAVVCCFTWEGHLPDLLRCYYVQGSCWSLKVVESP